MNPGLVIDRRPSRGLWRSCHILALTLCGYLSQASLPVQAAATSNGSIDAASPVRRPRITATSAGSSRGRGTRRRVESETISSRAT